MVTPAETEQAKKDLLNLFQRALAKEENLARKANIQACIAFLQKNGNEAVPDVDHVLFAHKQKVLRISNKEWKRLFTDPKTGAEYVAKRNDIYLVHSPFTYQKVNETSTTPVRKVNETSTTPARKVNETSTTPVRKVNETSTTSTRKSSGTNSSSSLPVGHGKPGNPAIVRTQNQASSTRSPSPTRSDISNAQSLPPVTADQKLQVAEYINKEKGISGMHLIFAKVRISPKYGGTGNDEDTADLDICYDTGSTCQVLHRNEHWKAIGGLKNYTLPIGTVEITGAGGIKFDRDVVQVELRVFKDIVHKTPLTDWFETDACLCSENESLLSGFIMAAKQGLMFATVAGNSKLLVAHESHKLAFAWKVFTSG